MGVTEKNTSWQDPDPFSSIEDQLKLVSLLYTF